MDKLDTSIFKAYDVRGIAGEQIDDHIAYLIGRAYAQIIISPSKIVGVGRDVRTSGDTLQPALIRGLIDEGAEVVDLGIISTDMLYFGVARYELDGGLSVTASHNPGEYNGIKMVRANAVPISADSGLFDIKDRVQELFDNGIVPPKDDKVLDIHHKEILLQDYMEKLISFSDLKLLQSCKHMKIAFNANHGYAGKVITQLIETYKLPIEIVGLYLEPDGTFPQGRPDPLYPANQEAFKHVIIENKCDFGVAWDADADRVFFFDQDGEFAHSYYITALLTENVLSKHKNESVIIDPRLQWATIDVVKKYGATMYFDRVGHAFIKERMRKEDAIFAGEVSGHYYFRDFWYADNGMIPFLIILELMCKGKTTLKDMVAMYRKSYPIINETNMEVEDKDGVIAHLANIYKDGMLPEQLDGLSVEYDDWRFNLRKSNTEPLLRLNLEAKTQKLVDLKAKEIINLVTNY